MSTTPVRNIPLDLTAVAPKADGTDPRGPAEEAEPPRLLDGCVSAIRQIGEMAMLCRLVVVTIFKGPFSWREEFVDQLWLTLKRCLIPVAGSTLLFGFGAPGIAGGHILDLFGSLDRGGAFYVMTTVREFAPWVGATLVAGVAGTAICADLGARKVREELDAMAVGGVDPIRALVVPRFLALAIMVPLFNVVAITFGIIGGAIAIFGVFGGTAAGYLSTFFSNFTLPDLLGSMAKTAGFGGLIAIFCCYKGMTVSGGPQGVGRAVNQAVVLSFVGIFVFNYAFTSTMLAMFPETSNLH